MCLISLDDAVILRIFEFLNWIDSIHLATTCKRLKNLKFWTKGRNEEFNFKNYIEKDTVPIGNVLPVIGPYIRVAKITEEHMSDLLMEKCCNIKSLKIDGSISQSTAITLNTWMKQLQIESLSVGQGFEDYVEELLHGIEGLKTFVFNSFQKLLPVDFFHKNSGIQHLLLILGDSHELRF